MNQEEYHALVESARKAQRRVDDFVTVGLDVVDFNGQTVIAQYLVPRRTIKGLEAGSPLVTTIQGEPLPVSAEADFQKSGSGEPVRQFAPAPKPGPPNTSLESDTAQACAPEHLRQQEL